MGAVKKSLPLDAVDLASAPLFAITMLAEARGLRNRELRAMGDLDGATREVLSDPSLPPAKGLRTKLDHVFKHPGWTPEHAGGQAPSVLTDRPVGIASHRGLATTHLAASRGPGAEC